MSTDTQTITHTKSLGEDILRTLWLGIPLIISQVLSASASFVDSYIAGQVGDLALQAAGVATPLFFIVLVGCMGLINGLSPIFSKLIGERHYEEVGIRYRQGLLYGSAACLLGFLLMRWLGANMATLQIVESLQPQASDYCYAISWSFLFSPVFLVTRNLFEASEHSRLVMQAAIAGLVVNISFSFLLGLGLWGLPRLGLKGIAYATALSFLTMSIYSWMLTYGKSFRQYRLHDRWRAPQWNMMGNMLRLSLPIAIMTIAEAGLFTATSVQSGQISEVASGANFIALQCESLCFMLPLGLSYAIAARMGRALGARDLSAMHLRLKSGLIIAAFMACSTATMLILLRQSVVELFNVSDPAVAELAAELLVFAATFQLSDTTQATFAACLRGLHDTKVPMYINIFSYWVLGFGGSLLFAYWFGMGVRGLWIGLIIGLTASSVLLGYRLWRILGQFKTTIPEAHP